MHDDRTGDDVITLSTRQPTVGRSMLADLEQTWWRLASVDGLPRRRNVNAATMGAALPHGFIAERIAPGHARFRVAGRHISELMGSEARGMPLSCMFNPASRALFAARLEQVFETPAVVDIPLVCPRGIGRARLGGRMLILPLASDDGTVNRAMGAVFMDGPVGTHPRRCDIPEADAWRCDPFTPVRSTLSAIPGDRVIPRPAARRESGGFLKLVVNNA